LMSSTWSTLISSSVSWAIVILTPSAHMLQFVICACYSLVICAHGTFCSSEHILVLIICAYPSLFICLCYSWSSSHVTVFIIWPCYSLVICSIQFSSYAHAHAPLIIRPYYFLFIWACYTVCHLRISDIRSSAHVSELEFACQLIQVHDVWK
jgi:hypothetical protein